METILIGAVTTLSGAIAFLFAWFQSLFNKLQSRLDDCEEDRKSLWERLAENGIHKPPPTAAGVKAIGLLLLTWAVLQSCSGSPVFADDCRLVVRENCIGRVCSMSPLAYGSAVTIGELKDGRQALLTAAHVVRDAAAVSVTWYEGRNVNADVLFVTDDARDGMDVALLAAHLPDVKCCCPLADRPVSGGTAVNANGFCHGRDYVRAPGVLSADGDVIVQPHAIAEGMSGGPVCANKQLVGIISGFEVRRPNRGVITAAWRIRPWVQQHLGYLPECCEQPDAPMPLRPIAEPLPPASVMQELKTISERLKSIEAVPGPAGERGVAGERGEQGLRGPPGADGKSGRDGKDADPQQYAKLEDELAKIRAEMAAMRTISFPVRTLTPDGKVFSEDVVRLGDPIQFRLVPKAK